MLTKILDKYFPDSKITSFWHDGKARAMFLLPFWIAFIIILFVFFVIPYEKDIKERAPEDNQNETSEVSINEMWQNLIKFEYDFEYKVLLDIPITYSGSINNGITTGEKYEGGNTTNFLIDENGDIYTVNEAENILYGNIKENIKSYYLNINNLYNELKDTPYTKENNQYFYEKDDLYVIIDTDKEVINFIEIDYKGEKTIVKFNNFR